MEELLNHLAPGAKAAVARQTTITTSKPRSNPKTAPRNRSIHFKPASRTAQLVILPAIPANKTTAIKMTKNPTISATHRGFTDERRLSEIHGYSHAARRKPTTVPARAKASVKKPCAAACAQESTMAATINQSAKLTDPAPEPLLLLQLRETIQLLT